MVRADLMPLDELAGKTVAVDLPNVVYRHLFQIRGPDGLPYRNPDGVRIGHLIGLCNEISLLAGMRVRPIFVFDGKTPSLKADTARKRASARSAERGFKLEPEMIEQMERTLDILGLPWIKAPEEAEAQAASMTHRGAWGVLTNDHDALLFGASRVMRGASKSGAEIAVLSKALEANMIDLAQLIWIGILTGTDYNPGGIRGIGPKRALRLVKSHASLPEIAEELGLDGKTRALITEVQDYYLHPPIDESWRAVWHKPDAAAAHSYLVREMKLGTRSVERTVGLLLRTNASSRQTRLQA